MHELLQGMADGSMQVRAPRGCPRRRSSSHGTDVESLAEQFGERLHGHQHADGGGEAQRDFRAAMRRRGIVCTLLRVNMGEHRHTDASGDDGRVWSSAGARSGDWRSRAPVQRERGAAASYGSEVMTTHSPRAPWPPRSEVRLV